MKQVLMQKNALRSADIRLEETPAPKCRHGKVLLANRYSLISAGTEMAAVRSNKRDMVVKALRDPDIRQSVVEMVSNDGISKTLDRVQYEMTKWTEMGYSGSGVALEVADDVQGIRPGDLVAYAGQGHAEIIAAAKNLCVSVPADVSAKEACFVALGSIALQAVRRANIQLGDVVAVLGLGLVGLLTAQLLKAAGARVIGSDVVAARRELALRLGMEAAMEANDELVNGVLRYTGGVGVDRVLVCASTSSNTIIEQAARMCRDRGTVVIVGAVSMDLPRQPFYMKELDLVMSRSYGPGRYDPQYEQRGHDYPIGYVRWTEKRNMEEFLRLIQQRHVDVLSLISHEVALEQAAAGYEALADRSTQALAVVLRYNETTPSLDRVVELPQRKAKLQATKGRLAVIGCGSFASQFHLPNIRRNPELQLRTLATSTGHTAKEKGLRYGATNCTTDVQQIWSDSEVDGVVILTRDSSHAALVAQAAKAGKHVFCEKPLAMSIEDCRLVSEAMRNSSSVCTVGFNRRFAPILKALKDALESRKGPKLIHCRVNAGPKPADSWVYDPVHSAGRIVGEACHFTDLFYWLIGCEPVKVSASALDASASSTRMENVAANMEFADGSVATLIYTAAGSAAFPKERMEVFCDGLAAAMDDFHTLTVRGPKRLDVRHKRVDKGHGAEMEHFAQVLRKGTQPLITHVDGLRATACCLAIVESAMSGEPRDLDSGIWLD